MTTSHVAEGATRSAAIYALCLWSKTFFIFVRRPSFFLWILVDCRVAHRWLSVTVLLSYDCPPGSRGWRGCLGKRPCSQIIAATGG